MGADVRRGRVIGALVVAVALFVGGVVVGAYVLGGAGQEPCWQVEQDLQAARDTLSETFGGGLEGRTALGTLADTADQRPDCFSPATRESLRALHDAADDGQSPSDEATSTTVESPEPAPTDG